MNNQLAQSNTRGAGAVICGAVRVGEPNSSPKDIKVLIKLFLKKFAQVEGAKPSSSTAVDEIPPKSDNTPAKLLCGRETDDLCKTTFLIWVAI